MTRTTRSCVTFPRAFSLAGTDRLQPPGVYTIETDEERIENVSIPAYRIVARRIVLSPDPDRPGCTETVTIDLRDLAQAVVPDPATAPDSRTDGA
jgi:hypothetical protein